MYFVILSNHENYPVPMVDKQKNLATYETEEEAKENAKKNIMGDAFGYEIFEW